MKEHRPDYDEEVRQRARQLYEQGHGVRKVAELIGRSISRTHTLLKEAGAEMRPAGQPRKERDEESTEEGSTPAAA